MKISKELLFYHNSEEIYLYKMLTSKNMEIQILSVGATLYKILLPDLNSRRNILLTLANPKDYLSNSLFAGSSLGPVAGRIANGRLPIHGREFQLSQNDGLHHLHGGNHNISFLNWRECLFQLKDHVAQLELTCHLPNQHDGYPGNRDVFVSFSLEETGTFTITYHAKSDADTYFNLSNHPYFNLSGDYQISGLSQKLSSPASHYTYNDAEHLCLGMKSVENTPFDFQNGFTSLQNQLLLYPKHKHLLAESGYNNALVFPSYRSPAVRHLLSLTDSMGIHSLSLFSDASSVILYSGGYINDKILLDGNKKGIPSCAIALEPQEPPNAPWVKEFPYHITPEGETYTRSIVYQFK